jgi:hypothetical protein
MVVLGMSIVESNNSRNGLSTWYCTLVLALVYHSNLPFFTLFLFLQALIHPPWLQMQQEFFLLSP